jgi:hypothetical protein
MSVAYVRRVIPGKEGGDTDNTLTIEGLTQVGVAGDFVIFQYQDGSTTLEKADKIVSVQFVPDKEEEEEDVFSLDGNGKG